MSSLLFTSLSGLSRTPYVSPPFVVAESFALLQDVVFAVGMVVSVLVDTVAPPVQFSTWVLNAQEDNNNCQRHTSLNASTHNVIVFAEPEWPSLSNSICLLYTSRCV